MFFYVYAVKTLFVCYARLAKASNLWNYPLLYEYFFLHFHRLFIYFFWLSFALLWLIVRIKTIFHQFNFRLLYFYSFSFSVFLSLSTLCAVRFSACASSILFTYIWMVYTVIHTHYTYSDLFFIGAQSGHYVNL